MFLNHIAWGSKCMEQSLHMEVTLDVGLPSPLASEVSHRLHFGMVESISKGPCAVKM